MCQWFLTAPMRDCLPIRSPRVAFRRHSAGFGSPGVPVWRAKSVRPRLIL
jgi:hypothetical protein